tara:strand:- start:742 stop:1350 length:609 start_codon:yes stop_codon:yes gene_type:complete
MMKYTVKELVDFETGIAQCFNSSMIKAPVHLYSGNEDQMIEIFKEVKEEDWVFCTWRSHYQCLLKGVPPKRLKEDIIAGKSITLCYPDYNIYSSAIVTGSIPIATGRAFDIKRKKGTEHVWCFVGDMAAETGAFYENHKYAVNLDLPITYVIEDNGKSVCTITKEVWNKSEHSFSGDSIPKIIYYQYETKYPHAGAGKRIQF